MWNSFFFSDIWKSAIIADEFNFHIWNFFRFNQYLQILSAIFSYLFNISETRKKYEKNFTFIHLYFDWEIAKKRRQNKLYTRFAYNDHKKWREITILVNKSLI